VFGGGTPAPTPVRGPDEIFIQVRRGDSEITVIWPAREAEACGRWLREYLSPSA
jgi:hypothetical protein